MQYIFCLLNFNINTNLNENTLHVHRSAPDSPYEKLPTDITGYNASQVVVFNEDSVVLTQHHTHFWLAVHGKPVLFWKGISGLKFPCFLFYAC